MQQDSNKARSDWRAQGLSISPG